MRLKREWFRRRGNYALALLSEAMRPLLRLTARALSNGETEPPVSWRRGVLLGADHIGDVLYRTASLTALHRGLPQCEWYYVAAPPAAELLETNPDLAGCIPMSLYHSSADRGALLNRLRQMNLDVAICYDSSGYARAALAAASAGIPNRVGYVHKGCSGLITHPISIADQQTYPAYFRDLVAQVTAASPDWSLVPRVYPTDEDTSQADAFANEIGLQGDIPTLACFVSHRGDVPGWPLEKYALAIDAVGARRPIQVVLCGSESDGAMLRQLASMCHASTFLNDGRLGLRALYVFLSRCTVVLTADSGPRHLANAARVPAVFIRNLGVTQVETGCYCEGEVDVAAGLGQDLDWGDHAEALTALAPESAAEAVLSAVASSRTAES